MQRVAPPSAARVARQESGSAPASCRRLRVRGPAWRGHVGRGPGKADAGSGNACPPSGAGRDGAGRRSRRAQTALRAGGSWRPGGPRWPASDWVSSSRRGPQARRCVPSLHAARDGGAHPRRDRCAACSVGPVPLAKCTPPPARGPQGGSWGHPSASASCAGVAHGDRRTQRSRVWVC